MKTCPKCNAELQDDVKVCPICNEELEAPKKAFSQIVDEIWYKIRNPEDDTAEMDKEDAEKNKIISLFSYISILFLIPLLFAKDSKFAKYHVNQGFILWLYGIAVWIANIIIGALVFIPVVGAIVASVIPALLTLSNILLMVFGIYNAVTGKAKKLPFIGQFNIIK